MKKMVVVAVLALALALGLVLMSIPAFALSLGSNITIWDGSGVGEEVLYGGEDGEVEPGCVDNQSWDLEGFFLNGTTLTMVGGFDFKAGNDGNTSGDIFFDVNSDYSAGDVSSSDGLNDVPNSYGYDYALHLDFSDSNNYNYTLFSLTSSSSLRSVYYKQNKISTPWKYVFGGTSEGSYGFSYSTDLADFAVGDLLGGTHNAVAIDLSDFLDPGTDFTAHFTMKCGNDNLMGQGTAPVPEPQTLLLMGIGLLGLAFVGRKKMGDCA